MQNGLAQLDIDGSGSAASPAALAYLWITREELTDLATRYATGASFWRVGIEHFSAWDMNWGIAPPADATSPEPYVETKEQDTHCTKCPGSIVGVEDRSLGEAIEIPGTGKSLIFSSNRTDGFTAGRKFVIQLSGASVTPSLLRIDLDIEVAGQHFSKTFPPNTNLTETFIWNGKDGYGRDISSARVVATVRNVYKAVYQSVPKFGYNGNGTKIEANRAAAIFSFPTTVTAAVTRELGDPWQISGVDVLQQGIHKVQMSDGGVVEYGSLTGNEVGFVRNVQGTGVAFAKDGSYWIANHTYSMVYHYTEIGEKISETYVSGVIGVSIANDGSAIVSGYNGVGRVHIDGTLEPLVAQSGFSGDGGPAQNARVSGGVWDVAVDPIGQVLIADTWNGRIRRIALDGTITTVAGNGNSLVIGSTGLATSVGLGYPYAVASGRDGSIYMGTGNSNSEMVIRKIDPKGVIHTIAGGGYRSGAFANGFLGTEASLGWVIGLVELSNGDVCWTEYDRHISRCLDAKGIVYGFLGTGTADRGVDGVVASESAITYPEGMDQSPNGVVYVLDAGNNRLRSVTIGPKSGDNPVVLTTDGRVRAFTLDGRPQAILSAATYDTLRRFNYDDSLQLQSIVERNGDSISIERNGNALQITGPTRLGSKVTTFQKDGNGRYVQALLPDGRSYQMTYLPNGLLESFVTPRGARNIFAYTSEGELVSDSAVGAGTQRLSEQNDDGLRTVTRTEASGATQVFSKWVNDDTIFREQSALGGASTLVESLDNGTEITLYPDGSRIQRVPRADPQWGMAQPLYDEIQTLADGTSLTVHQGATATFATHGDPLSVTRRIDTIKARGITTISDWNPLTRTLVQKGPSGLATTIRFDHLDRVIDVKYGDSVIQSASYNDVTGLEIWINQGVTTKVWRNLEGPIDSALGPDGDTLRYLRDIDHQTVAMPQPGGGQVNLLWDARGRMVGLKPWEKGVHQFLFNSWGGDSLYAPPTVSGANGQVGYGYDELGRLKVIRYSASDSVVASFDGQSRTSSVQFNGNALSFGYTGDNSAYTSATRTFADGSVQSLTRSVTGSRLDGENWSGIVAGSVARGWNANQSLSSLSVNGQAINYAWGTDGHLAQAGDAQYRQDPISTRLNGMTLGSLVMNQDYDHQGLGSQIGDSVRFQNALVYGRHLKYDSSGRISESSELVNGVAKTTRYHYALGGQLDSVWVNGTLNGAYSYDNNGNRSDAVVDSQDQLVNSGSCTYSHDAKGQRASMICPDGTTTYGYDLLGNLLRVSKPNGQVIEYVVDAQGRRIGRKDNGILTQSFLYDGQLTPVAELDATGQVVSRFVYGSRANAPDYMIKNGVNYRLVSDERGSIRLVVNAATGAVVSSLEYDAWGNVTASVNASFQPFGFAGGLRDDATGLTRFGARDYDPKLGRWTAKDPIRFNGGLTNLYGYVGNDPVNLVDPDGTILLPIAIATGGVGLIGGAAGNLIYQLWNNGMNISQVDYRDVVVSAASGGIAGALLPVTGTTLLGVAATGALTNLGGYFAGQKWKDCAVTVGGAAQSALFGGVGGIIGGPFTNTFRNGMPGWLVMSKSLQDANTKGVMLWGRTVGGAGIGSASFSDFGK